MKSKVFGLIICMLFTSSLAQENSEGGFRLNLPWSNRQVDVEVEQTFISQDVRDSMHKDRSNWGNDPLKIVEGLYYTDPKDYEDFIDLGMAHTWLGNYLEAAQAYEKAAKTDPERLTAALYAHSQVIKFINLDC